MEATPLTVHIPSSYDDSNASELTSSNEHFQSTTSLPIIRTTSSPSTRRISFAPLPSIEPRRNRSTSHIKLGVSARSMLMQQRRFAMQNRDDENLDLPRGRSRDRDERWGGTTNEVPPGSKEMWQNDEMYPRTRTRAEEVIDPDLPFHTIGRLVKSAWSRVSKTPTRTRQPMAPSRSVGGGNGVSGQTLDVARDWSEEEMRLERRRAHSHETVKAKQMPPIDENDALDALGNASIRLKFKKPVLVRSASEPRKTMSVASTFGGR